MKKWILVALLFAVLFLSQLSAITYQVEVFCNSKPTPAVMVHAEYQLPGGTISDFNAQMTYAGPGSNGYNWYHATDSRQFSYYTTFNATATMSSQSSSASGMVVNYPVVTFPRLTINPDITPTPK